MRQVVVGGHSRGNAPRAEFARQDPPGACGHGKQPVSEGLYARPRSVAVRHFEHGAQVLPGSHPAGQVEHTARGQRAGAKDLREHERRGRVLLEVARPVGGAGCMLLDIGRLVFHGAQRGSRHGGHAPRQAVGPGSAEAPDPESSELARAPWVVPRKNPANGVQLPGRRRHAPGRSAAAVEVQRGEDRARPARDKVAPGLGARGKRRQRAQPPRGRVPGGHQGRAVAQHLGPGRVPGPRLHRAGGRHHLREVARASDLLLVLEQLGLPSVRSDVVLPLVRVVRFGAVGRRQRGPQQPVTAGLLGLPERGHHPGVLQLSLVFQGVLQPIYGAPAGRVSSPLDVDAVQLFAGEHCRHDMLGAQDVADARRAARGLR
mmetsp:Transcript_22635/g.68021  ORF Transcript_22635/g.68021 Transcript_22635/m.68021 type:complete len:374 (-) Transcript_22635:1132-2253(-)